MIGSPVGFAGDVWRSLTAVALVPLAVGVVLHVVKVGAEARSWHGVLSHAGARPRRIPFRPVLGAFVASIGAGAVLPAKLADVVRVGLLRRHPAAPGIAAVSGTIVLEAVLEALFGIAIVGWWVAAGARGTATGAHLPVHGSPAVLGLAGVAALVAVLAGILVRRRIAATARRFASGFGVLRHPLVFARGVVAWKLIAWALRFGSVAAFLAAFGLPAGPGTVAAVIAAQSVAGLIPLMPGNAGTQQAAIGVALAGVAAASAGVAFGVGMQAATVVADLVIGAAALPLVAAGTGSLRSRLRALRAGLEPPRQARLAETPSVECVSR
ncbi:MAG: lysylphosphatidylglycerol synthase domain-containing protein [Thermoleophilia bacterium]